MNNVNFRKIITCLLLVLTSRWNVLTFRHTLGIPVFCLHKYSMYFSSEETPLNSRLRVEYFFVFLIPSQSILFSDHNWLSILIDNSCASRDIVLFVWQEQIVQVHGSHAQYTFLLFVFHAMFINLEWIQPFICKNVNHTMPWLFGEKHVW